MKGTLYKAQLLILQQVISKMLCCWRKAIS